MDAMASKTSLAVEQFARGQFGRGIRPMLGCLEFRHQLDKGEANTQCVVKPTERNSRVAGYG